MSVPNRTRAGAVRRGLLRAGLRSLLLYGVVVLLLTLLQRKLMYQPTIVPELSPAAMGAEREAADVTTETDDGLTLHGWHWKSRSTAADKPLVLFFRR